ncbi:hypothetical protein ACL6C3_27425 [Capilliphycus salinus ALCB114379]|uniref:hypothetical protein n=1 Tax=Capilliphycus salinus TaxID=2768948 RepID=UPI0039A589BF
MQSNFFSRIGRWLDRVVDKLADWFGRNVKPILDKMFKSFKKIWKQFLEAALITAYGFIEGLYVIFYRSKELLGQIVAEFWDAQNPHIRGTIAPIEDGTVIVPASVKAQLPTEREVAPQFVVLQNSRS